LASMPHSSFFLLVGSPANVEKTRGLFSLPRRAPEVRSKRTGALASGLRLDGFGVGAAAATSAGLQRDYTAVVSEQRAALYCNMVQTGCG
jgi:hypothetical protein